MTRQARLDAPGTLHHVIVRGIEKAKIVDDRKDRHDFVSRMGNIASESETVIYAWALMKNHAHILLRSGPDGLPKYMRRFLTGYAINFNRRHGRYGHLFHNRYKSIVCDEDFYFRELVRYIHLNPLRVKSVNDLEELDKYPWCGHSVLIGNVKYGWQDWHYVLSWFAEKESEARTAYRQYVQEGIGQGRRPDLVGGGLIRSLGGWSQVLSLRRKKEKIVSDERILGSPDFVERIYREVDESMRFQLPGDKIRHELEGLIEEVCRREGISVNELRIGGRRGRISQVRSQLARLLVERYPIPLAEVARYLGVSTSAISRALKRARGK